jgi:hypothetical protein
MIYSISFLKCILNNKNKHRFMKSEMIINQFVSLSLKLD